jgi:HEAT repeat protein
MGLVRQHTSTRETVRQRRRGRDTDGLVAALQDPDPDVRRRSALDLDGVAEAIPALLAACAEEADPAAREALVVVLAGHDDPVVAAAFAADLRAADPVRRNTAATALSAMPSAVADLVEGLLGDPDATVRVMAMSVLGGLERPEVPGWLAGVVAGDGDQNVVTAAVDAALAAGLDTRPLLATALGRFPANPYLAFLAGTGQSPP